MSSYLVKYNKESLNTFSGQSEAEDVARSVLIEADQRIADLQAKVERLESYLDALSNGFTFFHVPWREDFKQWKAKAEGGEG